MKKSLITVIALSAVCLAGAFAADGDNKEAPKDKPHGRPPMRGEHLVPPRLVEELKLTDAQSAELKKLEDQFAAEREKMTASHKDEIAKLHSEMKDARDAHDEAKIKDLRGKRMAFNKPVMDLRHELMQQFTAQLTPEQKTTLQESRKAFRERAGKKRGDKPPPPPE